jgi:hypothetical protein
MSLLRRAEDIGLELKARLEACTLAAGAETDLGRKVYLGQTAISDDLIPCTSIIEGQDDIRKRNAAGLVVTGQSYAFLAYLPCDPDNPNAAAHKAIRDIKRAVFTTGGKPDPTWGGRVRAVEYLGRDIGARSDGAAFVLAIVEIAVEYVEDPAAP